MPIYKLLDHLFWININLLVIHKCPQIKKWQYKNYKNIIDKKTRLTRQRISTRFFYMQAVFATKSLEITNLMSANAFYILCQDRDIIDRRLCKLFPWHQNKIKMQMIKDATSHWPYYEVEWAKLIVAVSKWSETSSTSFLQNFVKYEAIRYLFKWNISRSVSWKKIILCASQRKYLL